MDQVVNMNDPEKGQMEHYLGLEQLSDPERYVDTSIQISTMTVENENQAELKEGEVKIWKHIEGSKSRYHYYVYQDWWWTSNTKPT